MIELEPEYVKDIETRMNAAPGKDSDLEMPPVEQSRGSLDSLFVD
jgi:hypothetical protein